MADEDGKVVTLSGRMLQRVQERLSSLEQGQSQILKVTNELPHFMGSVMSSLGKLTETVKLIATNQEAQKVDLTEIKAGIKRVVTTRRGHWWFGS
jgi:hypothetical protein